MKKIAIVILALLLFAGTANAQLLQFGIKGGINFSSLSMDDITGIKDDPLGDSYSLVTGESVNGLQVGVMARVKVAMLFVQPEIYFNTTGGAVEKVVGGNVTDILTVKLNRFDIPLLVGAKFGPARINVGPVGSYVINSANELVDLYSDIETLSSGLTWGFQAGVGLDILNKISVDGRYEGSLSRYGDSFNVGGVDHNFDARPSQWILAVGWWF